jgi:hypothetical protein
MEQETDFHSASYFLTITPDITLTGDISGRPLEETFSPGLNFRYDRVHFSVVKDEETGSPLDVTETGSLHQERTVPNTMLLLGMEAEIPALRWITTMKVQNLSRNNQGEFIRLRYQSLMIEIHDGDAIDSPSVIDVAAIDDLARLAEKSNSMILHATVEDRHVYYVQGTGSTFRVVMPKKMGQPQVDRSIGDNALSRRQALEEGSH